jgi:hypothetical protein
VCPPLFAFLDAELPRCDVLRFSPLHAGVTFYPRADAHIVASALAAARRKGFLLALLCHTGRSHAQIMAGDLLRYAVGWKRQRAGCWTPAGHRSG